MSSRYRYCGLQSFQSDDANVFFGRDQEVSAFLSMISQDKLAVLYGKPGIGKLSFLKAGVLPAVEGNFLSSTQDKVKTYAYFIQPHQYKGKGPLEKLSAQVYHQICNTENITDLRKVPYSLPENQNILWNHFKEKELSAEHVKNNFVFVFEHVEELFSYPQVEIHWFKSTLNDLLGDYAPNAIRSFLENEELNSTDPAIRAAFRTLQKELPVKIIFSISTDEFYLLNRFRDFLPNIFKNVFELKPMTEEQLSEAIQSPAALPKKLKLPSGQQITFNTEPFSFAPAVIDTIKNFVCDHNSSNLGAARLPDMYSFQAICSHCEKELVERKGISSISVRDILNPGLIMIIEGYYENAIKDLALTTGDEQKITSLLENEMIYGQDRGRLVLDERMIIEKYGVSKDLLQKLLQTRLISKESYESGGALYTISSDIIAEAILNVSEKRLRQTVVQQAQEFELPQLKQLNAEIEKNPQDYSGYKKRGDHYYFSKKYKEALADYERALHLKPDDLEIYNYIGIIYFETGEYSEAIKYFLQAVEKDKDYYQPLYNLGLTYTQLGKQNGTREDHEIAIGYFEKALKGNPLYADAYNQIGLIYEYYEEYDKARTIYLKALEINKDYVQVKINLGNTYYRQNDFEQARKYYDEVLSKEPNNALAIYNIGLVFWTNNDLANAESHIKKACELEPDFTRAFVYLAKLYLGQGKYDQVLATLKQCLQPSDEMIDLYLSAATYFKEEEDYEKAAECLNHIIEIDPQNLNATNNLGLLLYYQKKNTEALKIFEEIKKEHPRYYNAFINAGLVYDRLHDTQTAMDNFKQAYKIDSENILASYHLGRLYQAGEDYEKAIELFKKVEEINKTLPPADQLEVKDRMGEIYNKLNQPDNAIASLESFLKNDDTNASAYRNLALAYNQKGNVEMAFNSFYNFLVNTDWAEIELEDYKLYANYYEKVETINPRFSSTLNSIHLNYLGLAYEYLGQGDLAIKMYKEAIAENPHDYYPHFNLGCIYESRNDDEQALDYYLKAHETDSSKGDAIFGIANIYYHLNSYDEAEYWYSKVSEIDKDNPNVLLSFGNIAYIKGDYTKAYEHYMKSLEKSENEIVFNNLGMVCERLGDLDKAVEYNLESIKLNPSFGMPWLNLGLVYTQKRDYGLAFENLEKGLRREGSSYGFSNLGVLYHKLGIKDEALVFFEKSINIDKPEDDAYFNFATYYYDNNEDILAQNQLENTFRVNKYHKPSQILRAKINVRNGKFETALELLQQAELVDPADHFVKLELADLFIDWGKIDQAKTILAELKAVKFERFNILTSLVHEMYGKLYQAQKSYAAAVESYQKVILIEPKNEEIVKKIIVLFDKMGEKNAVKEMTKQLNELQSATRKEISSWISYSFFTGLVKENQSMVTS